MTGFPAAVEAIQRGDVAELERLLDAEPALLRERLDDPDAPEYFRGARLLWYVADNPILIETMPANVVDVARTLIARGAEREDLDSTLELVMTGAKPREQGHQRPLMALLLAAGATATPRAIDMTLAHGELDAVTALLERGYPMTAPIAAALGRAGELRELLEAGGDAQIALAQAVINDRADTARVALEHGADANAFMAVHAHSVPLHQAALHDDVELLALLVEHGARTDVRDTVWNGTPLGWARHEQRPRAAAYLESLA